EQQPGEGAEDYVHVMQQQASRLKKPLSERQLVKIVKKGLREGIARFVYAMDLLTVDELRDECIEVERNFGRRGRATYGQPSRFGHGDKPRVSEAYRGQTKRILFYVCPYLEQEAYFGVDFWQAFGLAPAVIGHGDPKSVKRADEIHARDMEHYAEQEDDDEKKPDPESWTLSAVDARQLAEIQEVFLTFEKDGLGTTNLETHTIELIEGAKVFKDRPKSKFCFKSLTYLGFIVGGGRLRMDPGRVAAIRRMPEPKSMKEVRAFLGTAGWYRRFIKNFATLAAPLTESLKKTGNSKFSLSPEAQLAIE
ncbi:hypothetical protein KR084_011457, partial [Drosophila pseudotakahashii]